MIAADTCSFVAYLSGEPGEDVEALDRALTDKQLIMPPMVLVELLSDPELPFAVRGLLSKIPQMALEDRFWERAGLLRSKVLEKKHKARLADALIAQICIDHKVPLITRDNDFRHFEKVGGLKLVCRG
ncbi:MAG: hypothetical protein ACD_62C00054G0003 [uncultured bacterium]|nr:MAG: hypothetical protein ACD_62C00054G0003 [uncultured bacterium]